MRRGFADSLLAAAKDAGWTVRVAEGGHLVCRSPQGKIVVLSGSPSDKRAFFKARTNFRHAGLAV